MPRVASLQTESQTELMDLDGLLGEKKTQLALKRGFDFIVSLIGLAILCPVLLVIALLVKMGSKGPVFFKQTRVGKNGKEFQILKFRTMIVGAEKKGLQITVGKDNRITKVGLFLRKYKLDELPQLINVLKGEMSLIGPRPEVPKYVAMYDEMQKRILKVRPGITDLASIEYRNENGVLAQSDNPEKTYIEEIMPRKIEFNLQYLQNISVAYDIKLIFRTIWVIAKQK